MPGRRFPVPSRQIGRLIVGSVIGSMSAVASALPGATEIPVASATPATISPATATPAPGAPTRSGTSSPAAAALLNRINDAAQHLNYDGVFVFQRGSVVQSSRIVHFAERGDDQYQKIDSLDGKPRSVLQHNDELLTFIAESHTVILDRRKTQDSFPALLSGGSARVLDVYRAVIEGQDRVAGVNCTVVALQPVDDFRFPYRLSIDPVTGLLMRAQTLDGAGRVLEQVAFSQVTVGAISPGSRKAIRNGVRQLGDWKQVRAPVQPVDMKALGWSLDAGVPGFTKVLELRRPMAAREPGAAPVPVDQAVFTDGLAAISLFIEPVDKSDRKPGEGQSGATHLLAEQHGAFWVTLIGEVPAATLRRFAASIQYHAAK